MLNENFFLIEAHKEKFNQQNFNDKLAKFWTVSSVEETKRYEDVYCAEVPEYGQFVLEGNILTNNCPYTDICPVFFEKDDSGEH